MVDSLRDQLLKCGIAPPVREQPRAQPSRNQGAKPGSKPGPGAGKHRPATKAPAARPPRREPSSRSQDEIDLAKAYAIRAQADAQERKRAEREAAEQARIKRENKLRVQRLLDGQALNKAEADQVRHFEYGGKIRRVHVDEAQLAALNAGELGVVQQAGRYVLVSKAIAEQVRSIDPHLLALLVDPAAMPAIGDDGVPDDLMW
jgi:uncharacterized protein